MNRSFKAILLTIGLAASLVGAGNALAQGAGGGSNAPAGGDTGGNNGNGNRGRGNFDRAGMQQQMLDRVKERLEVTDEGEWKIISGLVVKVKDARMEERRATYSGMMGGNRRGGGENGGGGRGGFNATPVPEAEDLQKSLDAKASPDEIKAKLAKLRDSRKEKEAAVAKAQENLRLVLTVRQEAEATMIGLLP